MPTPAILAGDMALPLDSVNVAEIKRATTYRVKPMGEEEVVVTSYRIRGEYIHVPRQYGITVCRENAIPFEDRTSYGVPVLFRNRPDLRDYQEGPVSEILEVFEDEYDIVFRARTAFGKTISALWIAHHYGAATLVVVDQENLKEQWEQALIEHFGMRPEDIGTIQGDKTQYKGKIVTIAMIQTLSRRTISKELSDYFGTVIFDEVHTTPTPTFHVVLGMFSATRRLAISATPEQRKDALKNVLTQSLGLVKVAADAQHDTSAVYFFRNPTVYSWYANVSPKIGRLIQEITQDPIRNLALADAIKWLYGTGRRVLAVSTNIDHVFHLRDLLYYEGVPDEDMAMYVGQEPRVTMVPDPTPGARRPRGWVKGTEYTPVKLGEVRRKLSSKEMAQRLGKKPITFATYGKFQKGIDDPGLAGGIDLVPRSAASQVHGRIKRGKATHLPIWITPLDENSYRAAHWMAGRTEDYMADKAVLFEWTEDGEVIRCDGRQLIRELRETAATKKEMRIVTDADGISTLQTPKQGSELKKQHETSIVEQIRSVRQNFAEDRLPTERPATPGRRKAAERSLSTEDQKRRTRLRRRQRG